MGTCNRAPGGWCDDTTCVTSVCKLASKQLLNRCRAAIEHLDQNRRFGRLVADIEAAIDAPETTDVGWTLISERLPESGVKVLGYWKNELGKDRRTCVEYVAPRTRTADGYWHDTPDDWFDCDESGTSWVPSGWYEYVEGSDEYPYTVIPVEQWRPLPAVPAEKTPSPLTISKVPQ